VWRLAEERLRAGDHEVVMGQHVFTRRGHSSASAADRAADLMDLFRDDSVGAVFAALGGHNSHQLLPFLDYDMIRRHPKVFVGFSDVTALVLGIYARARLVTFNGPGFSTFCQPELPSYTQQSFDAVVRGEGETTVVASRCWADNAWYLSHPPAPRQWRTNPGWRVHRAGIAEGPSLGGHVSTLLSLVGTPYFPDLSDSVLFLEDDETTTPARFDRALTQLRQIGVFERVRGLVVGRFPSAVPFHDDDSLAMVLDEVLEGYDFPVVTEVDFSHTDPLITIPMGVRCRLDTARKEIRYLEAAVG
jgi:muramoyltetrapeptide carboxypeptidase